MIWELIVTSAPRGLKPGRSGFTTVLQTRGIHTSLAESLEKASAYNHVYPQGDPRNPQIRAHSVRQGAWGTTSVLSRIVDAGNGYDGRSNKLAHHVAFDAREVQDRAKSSPAAVLLQLERANAFQRLWQEAPREQAAGPHVPALPSEPGFCSAWARAGGDAGWAGFIADRAVAKQPTWIIAPPGVDLVELFAEAMALVNYAQRWGITFTSYALDAGDALWLGTVDGSPQAQAARGQSRLAVVDLVRRTPLTAESPLIAAARGAGMVPWKREAVTHAIGVAMPAVVPGAAAPLAGSEPGPATGTRPPPVGGRPPALARGGVPAPGDPFGIPEGLPGGEDGGIYIPPRQGRPWLVGGLVAGGLTLVVGLIAMVAVSPDVQKELAKLAGLSAAKSIDQPRPPGVKPPEPPPPPPPPPPPDSQPDYAKLAAEKAAAAESEATRIKSASEDIRKKLEQIRGLATAFEQAVATAKKAFDEGTPVRTAMDEAGKKNEELTGTIDKVQSIKNEADAAAAAAAAKAAAQAASEAVAAAKRKEAPENVPAQAKQAEEAAKKASVDADNEVTEFNRLYESFLKEKERFDVASAVLMALQVKLDHDRQAFKALKDRLEHADHIPTQGIDTAEEKAQRVVLCDVGDARIELALPNELFYQADNLELVCRRLSDQQTQAQSGTSTHQKPETQGPSTAVPMWEVGWRTRDKDMRPLGTVSIVTGTLTLDLLPLNLRSGTSAQDKDPYPEHRPLARDALGCAVLLIRSVPDANVPGGATPPDDAVTYVQLAKPVEAGPIVIKKFFEGGAKAKNADARGYHCPAMPQSPPPWKAVFQCEKATCGKLQGELMANRSVDMNLVRGSGGLYGTPVAWVMAWKWNAKPVVITDLAAGTPYGSRKSVVKVVKSTLEDAWNTPRRLVAITSRDDDDDFQGFPDSGQLAAQTTTVPVTSLQQAVYRAVEKLSKELKIRPPSAVKGNCNNVLQQPAGKTPRSLSGWVTHIHTDILKHQPKYQAWAKDKGEDARRATDIKDLDRFWKWLAPQMKGEDMEDMDVCVPAVFCELAMELREIDRGKAEVRELLEGGLGYQFAAKPGEAAPKNDPPDATITGEIVIDFPSVGGRSVLVRFRPADAPRPAEDAPR